MIQATIYTAVRDRLATLPGIPSVDWEAGQADALEGDRPPVGYALPAVLVRFDAPRWRSMGRKTYGAELTVYLDVLQKPTQRLRNDEPAAEVNRTLDTYTLVQAVTKALNNLSGEQFGPFKLTLSATDHAYKKLRVDTLAYRTFAKTDLEGIQWEHRDLALLDRYTTGPVPMPEP